MEQADGLDRVFAHHITNKSGKYIVFCANKEHMDEMVSHVPEWFAGVNPDVAVYEAYSDDPNTDKAFANFKTDTTNRLKLLFCIDMQNYSVLMSVYFKEAPEYLKQAIESIQAQTFQTNDFVLVCDGPLNDGLDAIIAKKQQEMGETLNVVRLAKNGGLGNALNEGIKHCKNELVARICLHGQAPIRALVLKGVRLF